MSKSATLSILAIVILTAAGLLILKTPDKVVENPNPSPLPAPSPTPSPTPTPTPSRIAAGCVAGHVTIGPNCPVERVDMPCKTPPEAYTSRSVVIYESNGVTIKEKGKIDTNGNYKIALGPGKYFVQIAPAGIGPGEKMPATVKSFETTLLDFDIDTGIR